jgi:hypothetical protein
MTYQISDLTPPAHRAWRLENLTRVSNSGFVVLGLSLYGDRFYAVNATAGSLYESGDSGTTWTLVKAFGGTSTIVKIVETLDGEALLMFKTASATGFVMKSTGWTASRSTATWITTLISTGGSFGAYQSGSMSIRAANGVVVINEYGAQTDASHSPSGNVTAARRGYLSVNHGVSFTQFVDIYNMPTGASYPAGVNLHALAYDEYWDCVFMTFGDASGQGPLISGTNLQLGMCFNYRDAVPVWQYINPGKSFLATSPQLMGVAVTKSAILLSADGAYDAGIFVIPKTGFRTYGSMQCVALGTGQGGNTITGLPFESRYSDLDGSRAYPIFGGGTPTAAVTVPSFIITDDGFSTQELYREPNTAANPAVALQSPTPFYGPDIFGKVIANYNLASGALLIKSDLLAIKTDDTIIAKVDSGAAIALTSTVSTDITFIDLPEGTYELNGFMAYNLTAVTLTSTKAGYSLASGQLPLSTANGGLFTGSLNSRLTALAGVTDILTHDMYTVRIETVLQTTSRTTRVYLEAQATFSAGSVAAFGSIVAKRM